MTQQEIIIIKLDELRLQLKEENRPSATKICQEAIDYLGGQPKEKIVDFLSDDLLKELGFKLMELEFEVFYWVNEGEKITLPIKITKEEFFKILQAKFSN